MAKNIENARLKLVTTKKKHTDNKERRMSENINEIKDKASDINL